MNYNFAVYDSPMGYIKIEYRAKKLTLLKILNETPADFGITDTFTDDIYNQILEYIKCERKSFDVEIDFSSCSDFCIETYKELLKIPYGETRTYKQIAEAIGNPKASRAVGKANNQNPIHIIIPCHRVVGSQGSLTGYAAGVETKEFLLNIEQIN